MKILVLNSGSSSVKYQLWDTKLGEMRAKGLVSRIGIDKPELKHTAYGRTLMKHPEGTIDHSDAIRLALATLTDKEYGVLDNLDEIDAVGHRVVHGGEHFAQSVLIDDEVLNAIRECIPLAPLHNPPNLRGIDACSAVLRDVPQVAVFDTAFHQTMEPYVYMYGLPYDYYERYRIRRYGFHGTSHWYVATETAKEMNCPFDELKIITCHLGNGASITAVKNGRSVDTSMGFTPLEGVVMGTRCGDIDPAIPLFLQRMEGYEPQTMDSILNKKSGLLGLTGISNDVRDILKTSAEGNEKASLALDIYCYRIRKYIGAYAAAMGGLDAVVFTAGVGENSALVRRMILSELGFLGIELSEERNEIAVGKRMEITTDESPVKVWAIPTNEELVIARETERIVRENK